MIRGHRRILYQFEDDAQETAHTVEFVRPAERNPGWSHRVIIDGVARYWLTDQVKPSMRSARFFFEKHFGAPAEAQP
jgi:hypothetical protein